VRFGEFAEASKLPDGSAGSACKGALGLGLLRACLSDSPSELAWLLCWAQEEARGLKHNYIGTEHILLGLVREERGIAARVLESSGVIVERVREQVLRIVGPGQELSAGQIPFTPRAKKVWELALREALELSHNYIGTEQILLGLLRVNESVAFRILVNCNANPFKLRTEAITLAGLPRARTERDSSSSGLEAEFDPGWLDGQATVLKPLGAWIRTDLGRPPDVGDLLLAIVCVPDTR